MDTSSLTSQLSAATTKFKQYAPKPSVDAIEAARKQHASVFSTDTAIQEGDKLPPFTLPDALGPQISSQDLLHKSAILITFYRGGWCPYCKIALHDLQKRLDEFTALGVALVAISPELPDKSLSTVEKQELKFTVLSDNGNEYVKRLRIVWKQPDSLRPVFQGSGNDLKP